MKKPTAIPQASHLNSGTAVPRDELAWPSTRGPVLRTPKLHPEIDPRAVVTPYGGLALVEELCRSFDIAQVIDEHVHVLKQHQPFHESDHILAQAFNLYVGGTTLEDLASLQHDEAVRRSNRPTEAVLTMASTPATVALETEEVRDGGAGGVGRTGAQVGAQRPGCGRVRAA